VESGSCLRWHLLFGHQIFSFSACSLRQEDRSELLFFFVDFPPVLTSGIVLALLLIFPAAEPTASFCF
jgi:hypothetical protein